MNLILDDSLSAREMRAVEINASYLGVSRLQLMENAGRSVAEAVMSRFGSKSKSTIICGLGGNGGDGFVAARHLAGSSYQVEVLLLGSSDDIASDEALHNWNALLKMRSSIKIIEIHDSADIPQLNADVVVDALIGTGVKGILKSPFREMVKAINGSDGYKIAVDIPTGVESDSGESHGMAVKADLTLTFHKPKLGFGVAQKHLGELVVSPIGVPPEAELFAGPGDVCLISMRRRSDSHKGDHGRLLVIGGSQTYSGAPALTALGAYAVGVDIAYVAAPETAASIVAGFSPSLITLKLKGSRVTSKNIRHIRPFLQKVDAVAIGPGLGLHEETVEAVRIVMSWTEELGLPNLLDADAIKVFPEIMQQTKSPTIFTPHRGEFKLLTGKEVVGNFQERGRVVQKEAAKLGATILLKGYADVISDGVHTRYNWTGNPGMTVGGTGDVLSGVAAGFLAMGATPYESAVASAFVNGAAGNEVYYKKGYQLSPTDLLEEIPFVIEKAIKHQN